MDFQFNSYLPNTSSLLSLQLLDEIYFTNNTSINLQHHNENFIEYSEQHHFNHQHENTEQQNQEHKSTHPEIEFKNENSSIKETEDLKQPESFENFSNELNEDNHTEQEEQEEYFVESKENYEECDANVISSINFNNTQNPIIEEESPLTNSINIETTNNSLNFPHEELNLLLELKRQAMNSLNSKESTIQIQENLEKLFKKVEGVIHEIQQKSEINTKRLPQNLSIVNKVFELCLKNDENNWITFPSLNTLENYSDEGDENSKINFKTECSCAQTPSSSTTKFKKAQLLSLTKQIPYAQESHNLLNPVRSSRSKSKGIAVVSLEKEKKCLKVTLVNRSNNIKPAPKKNLPKPETLKNDKNDRKTSVFNANNFFSSKRVSTKIF